MWNRPKYCQTLINILIGHRFTNKIISLTIPFLDFKAPKKELTLYSFLKLVKEKICYVQSYHQSYNQNIIYFRLHKHVINLILWTQTLINNAPCSCLIVCGVKHLLCTRSSYPIKMFALHQVLNSQLNKQHGTIIYEKI